MLFSFLNESHSLFNSISNGLVSAVVFLLRVGEDMTSDSVIVYGEKSKFSLIMFV